MLTMRLQQVCKAMLREGYLKVSNSASIDSIVDQTREQLLAEEKKSDYIEKVIEQVIELDKELVFITENKTHAVDIGISMKRFGINDRLNNLSSIRTIRSDIESFYHSGKCLISDNPGHMKNFLVYLSALRQEKTPCLIPVRPIK